ncbi:DMT family transporter [Glaciecola sp. MH2013]|uniref:DMT family transporter n=1 Tax=Glaciecola sp. MH2013 TaxID=2785524 RepID=UPI00189E1115|nr:DMT family transporter [Glaciecola sp. MH2013]MBF7071916.1 DMT family transporter [Glaciecola sp. MH2013]
MNFTLVFKTSLALLAFAGNSVLCRLALEGGSIDPTSFTSIRIVSGAITLGIICLLLTPNKLSLSGVNFKHSDWVSGLSLFIYAAAFSFAYISLATGTGALILFASVQITMLGVAIFKGLRLNLLQWTGFIFAIAGLVYLLLPGLSAPPLFGALLMMCSGIAWGVYSIKGKTAGEPTLATTENFLRALPYCLALLVLMLVLPIGKFHIDAHGLGLAIASGAITSGLGYAIWYAVLPSLKAASAATLQLTVPIIATIGGLIWVQESITLRLIIASASILGGVALVVWQSGKSEQT